MSSAPRRGLEAPVKQNPWRLSSLRYAVFWAPVTAGNGRIRGTVASRLARASAAAVPMPLRRADGPRAWPILAQPSGPWVPRWARIRPSAQRSGRPCAVWGSYLRQQRQRRPGRVPGSVACRLSLVVCLNGAALVRLGSIMVMVPADSGVGESPVAAARLDAESSEWLRALGCAGPAREAALGRLHELLTRIARGEVARRGPRVGITGPELEDVAYQAAADALLAITGKLGQFRGECRFTTWAYKFVILEVSAKIGRHFWRHPAVPWDAEDWDRLPARFGFDPADQAEWRELLAALRRAVDEELTSRQRRVFVAIVLNGVPLDALTVELASNRNAIYKTLFDARRKLRAALAANGYIGDDSSRSS
jgi:RNA polymerase sigma-70 factor (ECF subfamily)